MSSVSQLSNAVLCALLIGAFKQSWLDKLFYYDIDEQLSLIEWLVERHDNYPTKQR